MNITDLPSGNYNVTVYDTEENYLEDKTRFIAYPQYGITSEAVVIVGLIFTSMFETPELSATPHTNTTLAPPMNIILLSSVIGTSGFLFATLILTFIFLLCC